jgi:hypothetical protein
MQNGAKLKPKRMREGKFCHIAGRGKNDHFQGGGGGGYGGQIFLNTCRNKRTPPDDAGDLIGEDLEELDLLRDPGRVFTCRKLGQTVYRKEIYM